MLNSPRLIYIGLIQEEERSQCKSKYGIRLPASTRIVRVKAVENLSNFYVYKLSLTKETHDTIFSKKNMSKIPGDNGSSLNIPITIKIIALPNITLIETSVSVVYP
jgi:hypothetical protein